MAYTEEFDCLVIGDGPAGLWLLEQLDKTSKQCGPAVHSGWVQLDPNPSPVCVSTFLADDFDLTTHSPWFMEMISRNASLTWEKEALLARYPDLPFESLKDASPSAFLKSHELNTAKNALKRHPELLAFSLGFWQYFGRTHHMRPESIVLNALLCTELAWWDPRAHLPDSVASIPVASDGVDRNIEKISFSKRGLISIQLKDQTTLLTRTLILNTSIHQLKGFEGHLDELFECLNVDLDSLSHRALYPLTLTATHEAIPSPVPPISIYFDNVEVPSLEEEIWPFECFEDEQSRSLRLWVSWPWGVDLEGLLKRFRLGVKHLNWLFPFLSTRLKSLSIPLEMESCFSQESRKEVIQRLESQAMGQFEVTRIHANTRRKNVFFLSSFVHCYLPYPFGPLSAARQVMEAILGKKTIKAAHKAVAASEAPKEENAPPPA